MRVEITVAPDRLPHRGTDWLTGLQEETMFYFCAACRSSLLLGGKCN